MLKRAIIGIIMQAVTDILLNLVSDLLSWIIVGSTLTLFALRSTVRNRKHLFEFFGLSSSQLKVQVYTSRVNVKLGGATMIGGEEWPTFQGPVLTAREFIVLPTLDRLFRSPYLDNLPHSVRSWLGSRFYSLQNIEINFEPSPLQESEITDGTVILLGSRLVNIGTRYYQDKSLLIVDFDSEKHELVVTRGSLKGMTITPSSEVVVIEGGERPKNDVAIIQRIFDRERKRTVLIAAGTGTNGTMAATLYLVNQWEALYKRFGPHDKVNFAVIIECPNRRFDEKGYLYPVKRDEFTA